MQFAGYPAQERVRFELELRNSPFSRVLFVMSMLPKPSAPYGVSWDILKEIRNFGFYFLDSPKLLPYACSGSLIELWESIFGSSLCVRSALKQIITFSAAFLRLGSFKEGDTPVE